MNQAQILQVLREYGYRTDDLAAQYFSKVLQTEVGPFLRADIAHAFRWFLKGKEYGKQN
jgi:hypothetical protein